MLLIIKGFPKDYYLSDNYPRDNDREHRNERASRKPPWRTYDNFLFAFLYINATR